MHDETGGTDGGNASFSAARIDGRVTNVSSSDAERLDSILTGAVVVLDKPFALQPRLPELNHDDRERVDDYVARASSEATLRAYRSDWKLFVAWCSSDGRGYIALPASPATTAAFLSHLARHGTERTKGIGLSKASIGRRLAAIVFAHRAAGVEPPTSQPGAIEVDKVMRGIRRDKRGDVSRKKRAADGDILRDALRSIEGDSLRSCRDRALLAIGMGGAFRRSELVAIDVAHIADVAEGLEILVPFSKTDQDGRGAKLVIPDRKRIDPVGLYRVWIDAAGITEGPVFRKLTPQGRLTAKAMSDER